MIRIVDMAKRIYRNAAAMHGLFITSFLVFFLLPAIVSAIPLARLPYIFLYGLFLLGCIYAGRWNCRRWFLSSRFAQFSFFAILSMLVLSAIGIIGAEYSTHGHHGPITITVLVSVVVFFLLGVFFSITRSAVERQIREAAIIQQHRESELQLLRSQISPHFLFNILNDLYGTSLASPEKVPALLLKLSELLRYSLYETRNDAVALAHEAAYLKNYMEFEQLRIGDKLDLTADIQAAGIGELKIAPMLLAGFVENAFKHSRNTYNDTIRIRVSLQVMDRTLAFSVSNSVGEESEDRLGGIDSGIGLANTIARLDLLYPGRYELIRSKSDGCYHISLTIGLQ